MGAVLVLVLIYVALAWTLLLLGVWCIENGDCSGTSAGYVAAGVISGTVAVVGLASLAWAVSLGVRLSVFGRPAPGGGRAILIFLACLGIDVLLGIAAFTV